MKGGEWIRNKISRIMKEGNMKGKESKGDERLNVTEKVDEIRE